MSVFKLKGVEFKSIKVGSVYLLEDTNPYSGLHYKTKTVRVISFPRGYEVEMHELRGSKFYVRHSYHYNITWTLRGYYV